MSFLHYYNIFWLHAIATLVLSLKVVVAKCIAICYAFVLYADNFSTNCGIILCKYYL